MSRSPKPSLTAVMSAFAVVYLVWGSTYLAIRYAVETIPPFMMAGIRFLVAGLAMGLFLLCVGKLRMTNREWLASGWTGILMLVGGNGLVCWAEQVVPSGVTALIVGTAPLWIVSFEWMAFGGSRPSWAVVIGLLLGLVGVAILASPTSLVEEPVDPLGAAACLLACVFWAWGSLATRSASLPSSAMAAVTAQMIVGGTVLLCMSIAFGEPYRVQLSSFSMKSLLSLLYLIVFGAILAYTCYNWLFRVCKPAHVATYAYINPIVAVVLGWWLADEELGLGTLIAAALILAGVFLVTIRKRGKRSPDEIDTPDKPAPSAQVAERTALETDQRETEHCAG